VSLPVRLASTPAGRLARIVVRRTLGGRPRVVRVLGGAARGVRLELDLGIEKEYWLGIYERDVQELLRREVGPGDVVYDVGAHVGFFAVCAARLGARVYAFEVSPGNAARLRRNVQLNALPIEVVEAAVWESDCGVAVASGGSDREWIVGPGGSFPSVTLDSFAAAHEPPTLLKIDVEGAEAHVLRGASTVLAERPPVILCEVHGPGPEQHVRSQLAGFAIETLPGGSRLVARPRC
jgi:FkbM family methyltransferase